LIGYWYTDMDKAIAGKKAFVVNRVGDFGFLIGMFLIFTTFGTLDFMALQGAISSATASTATITAICLLLFVGCMGKSAQIPLYIWLPDAMAGPTPVSALIHAATMVTSGIYMVVRLNFLYNLSETAMCVVAVVGAFTAFFAATIAIAQTDIKKVLAYSTVSQLGYMFLGCGVGAYTAGVFHVITHAFFKALLFLGAGSVIHGMHEEQDITKMGGLKKHMPHTFIVFTIGWLAICGLPPFSGFFSKDEILWTAFAFPHGSILLWILGAITAIMTAFYMTRLWSLTFLGKERHKVHAHESPWVMVAPLYVLAVLSAIGGFMGIPHMSWLEHWLEPIMNPLGSGSALGGSAHVLREGVSPSMEWILMGVSVAGAGLGIWFSLKTYGDMKVAEARKKAYATLHRCLENKWYVDEIFESLIVKPIHGLSIMLWRGFDVAVIDRIVLGFGRMSEKTGQVLRLAQTGSIQAYAFFLLFGLVLTVGYLVYGLG
jgi:NADH-quinone oxidoreductase subunit L